MLLLHQKTMVVFQTSYNLVCTIKLNFVVIMLQFILFIYVHVINIIQVHVFNILFIYVHMWLKCLCTLSYLVGHVYVVIAPNDNDEQTKYWLARCVEPENHQVDDDGF